MSEQPEIPNEASSTEAPNVANTARKSKIWHASVSQELRIHMIKKIIQSVSSLLPNGGNGTPKQQQLNLHSNARKLEHEIYWIANSRTEYCHLISDKVYKIQTNMKKNIRQSIGPDSERQSSSLASCIRRSPFVQQRLRLGIPFLVYPHVSIGNILDTSNSTSQNLNILSLDQVGRWVDGEFELNDTIAPRPVTRNSSTTNNSSSPPVSSTDPPSREKFMKQHLIFLLHAHKCGARDKIRISQGESITPCNLPHCSTMKKVLQHITTCELFANCTFPQCNISKELMKHWNKCDQEDCSLCIPMKKQRTQNKLISPKNNLKPSVTQEGEGKSFCTCRNHHAEVTTTQKCERVGKRKRNREIEPVSEEENCEMENNKQCKQPKLSMEDKNSKAASLKLTIEEHLECPVCLNVPDTSPVFQCNNGHLICCKCREKLTACPVCRVTLGYSRNLTSEKMISLLSLNRNEDLNFIST